MRDIYESVTMESTERLKTALKELVFYCNNGPVAKRVCAVNKATVLLDELTGAEYEPIKRNLFNRIIRYLRKG